MLPLESMSTDALFPLVGAAAATTVVLSVLLFTVKVVHHFVMRAAGVRRALYIGAVGEMIAHGMTPSGRLQGWADDPIFEEVVLEYLDIVGGEERERLEQLIDHLELRHRLAHRIQRSRRRHRRVLAAARLAEMARPDSEGLFLDLLQDPNPEMRLQAARGLARLGNPATVPAVVELLARETPWSRARLADMLVEYGTSAVPHLCEWLMQHRRQPHPDLATMSHLIRVLGLIGDPQAEAPLLAFLHAPQAELRIAAASALGNAGGVATVAPLITALNDDDWRVRARAAASLGSFADPRAVEPLGRALRDVAFWVRQNAAAALVQLPGGVERLVEALDDYDRYARDSALLQLGLAGTIRAARARKEDGRAGELDQRLLAALQRAELRRAAAAERSEDDRQVEVVA